MKILMIKFFLFYLGLVFSTLVSAQIIEPEKRVLATFAVQGQMFTLSTKNPKTINQLVDLWWGSSRANIPVGRLRWGPGEGYHNSPWNWHMDSYDIQMSEFAIEVCDGVPSDVENNLFYWIEQVGYFCPWSARLIKLQFLFK